MATALTKGPMTKVNFENIASGSSQVAPLEIYVGATNVYDIFEAQLPKVRKHIERLNARAVKLGANVRLPEIGMKIFGDRMVTRSIEIQPGVWRKYTLKLYSVALTSPEEISLGGWRFIAKLRHNHPENENETINTVFVAPGQELPVEYRFRGPYCDHCGQLRQRKDTYVVANVEGEFKQVGSSCLRDFLGHDPQVVIGFFNLLDGIQRRLTEPDYNNATNAMKLSWVDVDEYMVYVAAAIRNWGWVPSQALDKTPTKWAAFELMYWPEEKPMPPEYKVNAEDDKLATDALKWIRGQDRDVLARGKSNYMYNLYAACSQRYTREENAGIVASLILAYVRAKGEEIAGKQKKIDSRHVGEVGQRLELKLTCTECMERDGNDWGSVVWLHKFQDEHGNVITWWGSKKVADAGDEIRARATVKRHGEFKGVKETTVTRLMVM